MNIHTERELNGHKLFVHRNAEGNVVVHAVTDDLPVTRLVYELSAAEARDFAQVLLAAARRPVSGEMRISYGPPVDHSSDFGAGLAAGFEEGHRYGRK